MSEVIDAVETPQQAARRLSAPALRKGYKPTGLHAYTNESGKPIYWRIRAEHETEPKWIRPMMQNSGGGYVLGEPPAPPAGKPLYGLHRIAADPAAVLIVTEGEKAADALGKRGIVATTSGGASSASAADWTPLKGRAVVIWPDADEPGAQYGRDVADKLLALGCEASIIDVQALGLPPKADAWDWCDAHPQATAADVLALPTVKTEAPADNWPEPQPLVAQIEPEPYPLDALPPRILAAVQEVQSFAQAPVALVSCPADT